jgi:replicative DNA helicase|tara:strand:- start:8584 stop:9852 length:1269 start_codon:yes stop_codon:yes gene_type:complete
MASAEQLLISKVLSEHTLVEVIDMGIQPKHFSATYTGIWSWLLEFWQSHSEVPTARALGTEYPSVSLGDASGESLSRLVEEVIDGHRKAKVSDLMTAALPLLSDGDTKGAISVLASGLQEVAGDTTTSRDVDLVEQWETRLDKYAEMRDRPDKLMGIATGFPGLDRLTAGIRPQQLVTFVGEAKRGKSMLTMVMAVTANINGISPLMVSFEMSAEEQAARHDAYLAKVSHTGLMRGLSTKDEVDRLNRELRIRKNRAPFVVVEDPASSTTVSSLAAKIKQHNPGIVFVDGVYMMDDENGEPKGSPQALTNITRSLKRLAQQYKVPIIITTQVLSAKLTSKVSRRVTADAIGYSSSFVQDSDIVMSVERDPDYEDRSIVRVLLSRTSPHGEVTIKWDWENMDFTEVGEGDDDDDEDKDDFHDW